VLVDYARTGGIAAFDDRLVIFDNGQAVYSRRIAKGEFTLPQDRLSEMKRKMQDECSKYVKQMRHCQRCRADAIGRLGHDVQSCMYSE